MKPYNSHYKSIIVFILCFTFLFLDCFYIATYANDTTSTAQSSYKKLTYDAVTDDSVTAYSTTLSDKEVVSYRVASFTQDVYVCHTLSSDSTFGVMPVSTFDVYYNPLRINKPPAKLGQVLVFNKEDINPHTLDIKPKNIKYGKDYIYITVQAKDTQLYYESDSLEYFVYTSLVNNLHLTVVPSELNSEENRVCGVYADFIFSLPSNTKLIAKSTKSHYTNYADKISFFYSPENEEQPEEIMELVISQKAILDKGLTKIYSDDLIYYVKITKESDFKSEEEQKNFKKTAKKLKRNNYYVLRKAIAERTTTPITRVMSTAPIYVDGVDTSLSYSVHEDGKRTFPIVELLESLGYDKDYKYIDEMIYFKKDNTTMSMQSGYSTIYTNNTPVELKYPLFINEDTLYTDLSTIKKLFGYDYKINNKGELNIYTK